MQRLNFLSMKHLFLKNIFPVVVLLSLFQNADSQIVELNVSANKRIDPTSLMLPLVEPHLAINPRNGDHMVVAAIAFDSAATSENRTHIVVFATKDNGKNWKRTDLEMTVGFDPWVAIRDNNQVALVAIAGYGTGHKAGLIYHYSTDGGFTWLLSDTVNFGRSHDHPTMVTDPNTGRLYVLSSVTQRDSTKQMHSYAWLNYSDDWKAFQKYPSFFPIGPVNSNTLTINVSPLGHLFIPFVEYTVNENKPGNPVFKYFTSTNGKGQSGPYLITDSAGLSKGFATSAVDWRGAYKGRTYFVKNTGPSPMRSKGIFSHYSEKPGQAWSKEIRIDHNQEWEKVMRTAAIAVNNDGVVGIVWVDRRNDPELKKNDIYFTVSIDGGETYMPEIRITSENSDPGSSQNGKAGERFISGGDYMGCAAKPDGSFQLVWADNRTGLFQLYTANVRIDRK